MRIAGGLLGHWAVWTRRAVELLEEIKAGRRKGGVDDGLLGRGIQLAGILTASMFSIMMPA